MKNYFAILFTLFALISSLSARVYYVTTTGISGNGGTNWASDAKDITSAISSASSSDEIWVKTGTYNATSTLLSLVSKKIYGGFAGTETAKTERVKSDMDGNGLIEPWEFTNESKIDGGGLYPVFSVSGNGALVDGMVFQNGFTNVPAAGTNTGTGLSINSGASTNIIGIINCTIRGNKTTTVGATGTYSDGAPGVYVQGVGVTLDGCLIEKNNLDLSTNTTFTKANSISGAGILLVNSCLKNSIVRNNICKTKLINTYNTIVRGAGVFARYSSSNQSSPSVTLPRIINCVVANNEILSYGQISGLSGAGLYVYDAGYVQNCTVVKNKFTTTVNADGSGGEKAIGDGAGLYVRLGSTPSGAFPNRYVHNTVCWGNYSPAPVASGESKSQIYLHTTTDWSTVEFKNVITTETYYGYSMLDANCTNGSVKKLTATACVIAASTDNAAIKFNNISSVAGNGTDAEVKANWSLLYDSYLKGLGANISGLTTDLMGNNYHASTPAVGAYETVLLPPTGINATAGTSQASVAFTAPANDGGYVITGYTVTSNPGNLTATGAGSPLTVNGLTNGTVYTFTVVATNALGNSVASSASNAITPVGVPNAPTGIVATAGNTQASVAFNIPANGGSAITGYTVYKYIDAVKIGTGTAGSSSPITVTGLTNGTAYTFRVVATNIIGNSAYSSASNTVTPDASTNNIPVSTSTNISALTLTPVSDIVISANKLTINAPKTVNSITVAPGAEIELTSGNTLTAASVILQSDATGTATLVDNTTTAPQSITATVQQYVEAGRNWYMSIPLESAASSLLFRGTSVVCFDEPSGTWIAPAASTLNKLRGYIQTATTTPLTGTTGAVDFTGVVNTGAHSISLTRTAGKTGFNLVGNPYPSYLDWNAVTKTNVSNTLWYRTKEGASYKFYTYNTVDGRGGIGVPATITQYIPPMQAFWVRVVAEGAGSIAVDNNMRSHKDVTGNIMKAPKQSTQQLLRLQVSNGTNTDETVLYFNADASDTFDKYDAQKRSNNDSAIPEIFTQVGTEQVVINGLNSVKYDTEIPLGFTTGEANNFSIVANEISNFEADTRVILIDKLNPNVEIELTNGTAYNFSAAITTPNTNRFSLLFRTPDVTTGIDTNKPLAQVFLNANNQISIITPEKNNYAIYNAVGQLISTGITTSNFQTSNFKLASGVYVVKVANNSTRVIIK